MTNFNNYVGNTMKINSIISQLKKVKFNFASCRSTASSINSTKDERTDIAKLQETIMQSAISNVLPNYEVLTCEEWCERYNLQYSHKLDSYYGDIMIVKDNVTLLNIDLKSGTGSYLGTPDALSLSNFGNHYSAYAGKYIYLCVNENNRLNPVVIDQKKIFDYYKNDSSAKFISSRNRTRVIRTTIFDDVKIMRNSLAPYNDLTKLYEEDFVPTATIQNYKFQI